MDVLQRNDIRFALQVKRSAVDQVGRDQPPRTIRTCLKSVNYVTR
jgi:hypothetical protein